MGNDAILGPFTEVLRTSPRGAAAALALRARKQLLDASTCSLGFLRMILLTLVIPAEALARRMILVLAAGLPLPVGQGRRPAAAPPVRRLPPDLSESQERVRSFRMTERLPGAHARNAGSPAHTLRVQTEPRTSARMAPEQRLLGQVYERIQSVIEALRDPDAEAARFVRRLSRSPRRRPPLAFGQPPGLQVAAHDPILATCFTGSDRDAEAAWSRLCDTS